MWGILMLFQILSVVSLTKNYNYGLTPITYNDKQNEWIAHRNLLALVPQRCLVTSFVASGLYDNQYRHNKTSLQQQLRNIQARNHHRYPHTTQKL